MTRPARRPRRRRSSSAPTAGGRGSPTTSRSRTSAAAPTASPRYVVERGEQAKGVVVAYDRRFASEHFAAAAAEVLLAHDIPVAFAGPRRADPDELATRSSSAARRPGIVITASHNPWTDNGFKVKAPTGAAAGAGDPRGRSRRGSPPTAGRPSSGGRSPTPRPPGSSSGSTRTRATSAFVRADARPRRAPGGRHVGAGRADVGRRAAAGSRACSPAAGSGSPRSTRSATRTSAASTRSRSGPHVDEALGIAGRRRLRPGPAARRRRGPGGRGRRARHVHPPAPGHRAADVLPRRAPRAARAGRGQRQQHLDGRAARRALRHRRPTRRRSGSSSSARR